MFVKATYFKSTKGSGSHQMVFGYDTFNDKRFANNHQSGSDYRISGDHDHHPGRCDLPATAEHVARRGSGSTRSASSSSGTTFRTHGVFYNDNWRWTRRVTVNLGLRYDKNHGVDSAGNLVANDSAWSPRARRGVGSGRRRQVDGLGERSKYVAALNSSIADSSSAAGNPATLQWQYTGPAINADSNAPTASLIPTDQAIQQRVRLVQHRSARTVPNGNLQVLVGARRSASGFPTASARRTSSPTPAASAARFGAAASCGPTIPTVTTATSTRSGSTRRPAVVTDEFGNPADLAHRREHQRPEAPVLGRHGVGDLSARRANGHRRQLHAVAAVGQLRRRERRQRTAHHRHLPVSGVPSASGTRRKGTSPPISVTGRRCGSTTVCTASAGSRSACCRISPAGCRTEPSASAAAPAASTRFRSSPTRATRTPQGDTSQDLLLHRSRCLPHRELEAHRLRRQLQLRHRCRQPKGRAVHPGAGAEHLQHLRPVRLRRHGIFQRRRATC